MTSTNNSLNANETTPLPSLEGGTGVSNSSTFTIGGNFALSGAYAFTGTLTNTTTITFPTSGTLATTAAIPSFPLSLANGGTNAALTASNGGIFYSTASAGAVLSGTSTASQVLLSGSSAAPAWSTATYPATTTVNQVLYSSSTNVIAGLSTANDGVLITSGAGVPSISSTLPATVQGNITALGAQGAALNMNTNQINNLVNPSSAQDAATKNYVDNAISGINPADSVVAATTAALTVTYDNGASGIGATLTNAAAQAAFSIDGQSPTATQRVLIKNQASTFQNGVYTVTTVGSGASNWVLTRAIDYDEPSSINSTGAIPVIDGTTNGSTSWLLITTVTTVGTDAITYTQFTYKPTTFLQVANNLSDLNNAATALVNIGGFGIINTQVFTAGSNTYTPTANMKYCIVEICGGGGGGGGADADFLGSQNSAGTGGGGGGYCRKTYSAALIGANAAVVVGAGGAGGAAGFNNGSVGSGSTFTPAGAGAVLTAGAGGGGTGNQGIAASIFYVAGTSGGSATGGDINIPGTGSGSSMIFAHDSGMDAAIVGIAGSSFFSSGQGPYPISSPLSNGFWPGVAGAGYGDGGGGAGCIVTSTDQAGGAGAAGICIVTEFIS